MNTTIATTVRRALRMACDAGIPGRYVAVERLAPWYAGPSEPIARIGRRGRLRCDLGDTVQRQVYFGLYDPAELALVSAAVQIDDVCFDVGANVGTYSLAMADRGARVHAFEPIRALADRVRMNARLSGFANRIAVVESAVGATTDDLVLHERIGAGNSGWASVTRARWGETVERRVPCTTLDAYVGEHGIERVALLKLDVEGAEPAVLEGAAGLLSRRDAPDILVELNEELLSRIGSSSDAIRTRLRGFGYKVRDLGRGAVVNAWASKRG